MKKKAKYLLIKMYLVGIETDWAFVFQVMDVICTLLDVL